MQYILLIEARKRIFSSNSELVLLNEYDSLTFCKLVRNSLTAAEVRFYRRMMTTQRTDKNLMVSC